MVMIMCSIPSLFVPHVFPMGKVYKYVLMMCVCVLSMSTLQCL